MNELELRARAFATAAHAAVKQTRKYSDEPYIVHPIRVAEIVRSVGGTSEQIAAAYLHDVVEDTGVEIDLIYSEFGPVVGRLVAGLTDVSKKEDGNRRTRKEIDRKHTAEQDADVQTVKLADLIDNGEGITVADPSFAVVWMREKEALLEVLTKGHPDLLAKAWEMVRTYKSNRA